jgi:Response regulator receiver domain/Histidine kinase-, DNA gyrase B-, and HSP90-like ATPase
VYDTYTPGVLVVDDDVEIRSVMWALLTDEGYHVRTAVNGRDALAILSSWCPDVILLDMMMPTMDGPTFLTIQQSNPKLRRIPVADRSRIFERFQRGRNVEGQVAGSGVGLAGVRLVIEQHGGSVGVESQEGVGSTFTVRLPLE